MRPWQTPCPPLPESVEQTIKFPSDDEDSGLVYLGWRGPSGVKDLIEFFATLCLMEYLTESSVSPLRAAFVENKDPLASAVAYSIIEQSDCVTYLMFENVPTEKIEKVKPKLFEELNAIVKEGVKAERLKTVIRRRISKELSAAEDDPHGCAANLVIGDVLYGTGEQQVRSSVARKGKCQIDSTVQTRRF